jgi:myosin-5
MLARKKTAFERSAGDTEVVNQFLTDEMGFFSGRPVAACLLFRSLLQWHSFEAERTNLFDRIVNSISGAIERNVENNVALSYWLSNTTLLLHLLQKTLRSPTAGGARRRPAPAPPPAPAGYMDKLRASMGYAVTPPKAAPAHGHEGVRGVPQVDAKYPALLFKQQLSALVEKIYSLLRDNVKKDITPQLSACIQAPKASKPGGGVGGRVVHLSTHWRVMLDVLENLMATMRSNHVPQFLVRKFFTQIFSFINVQARARARAALLCSLR